MKFLRVLLGLLLGLLLASGCDPEEPTTDGGSCPATVSIGTMNAGTFEPIAPGDPAELILGFQGFRMLQLALRVDLDDGAGVTEAEVSSFVEVTETGVELGQRTRETQITTTDTGLLLEEWLLFFNDEPPARVIGQTADLEVIVRAAGCVGTTRTRVAIRDDDACVDQTIVVDGGTTDAGLSDASVCETP